MAIQVKRRRGNTAAHNAFTGAQGELTVNTDTNRAHVHDGSTVGGHPSALLSDLVVNCTDTSLTANTITVASTVGPAAAVDGMILLIKVANLSTGGCTIAYNGAAAASLVSGAGAGLVSGALQSSASILAQYRASTGKYYLLARDGGNPQFASPLPISQGGTGASTVAGVLAALGLTEALTFAGTWNASTNSPALASGSGTVGAMYKVTTAGTTTLDGIASWAVGDQAVFSGITNTWVKIDGVSSEVLSVAGRTGAVVITSADLADFATAAAAAAPVQSVAGRTGPVVLAVADVSGAAPLDSPALTGTPTAPTPGASDNSTKLATTAFVAGQVTTLNSTISAETTRATGVEAAKVNNSAVGAANGVAPLDSSAKVPLANLPAYPVTSVAGRTGDVTLAVADVSGAAPLASPSLTGTPTAPTPVSTDSSTNLATTAFVHGQVSTLSSAISAETSRATTAEAAKVNNSAVGAANGVAPLDSNAKVPLANLPAALSEAIYFAGTWNASTNSPALASGSGTVGAMYKVTTAGTTTLDGIASWAVGDQAVFSGSTNTWDKIDGISSEVQSVAGRTGNVTLAVADVSGAAPLASPSLTGTPTAPTPVSTDNSTNVATTAYVQGQVTTLNSTISAETTRATGVEAAKVNNSSVGAANGVAPLDSNTKVPLANLPTSSLVTSVAGRSGAVTLTTADVPNAADVTQQQTFQKTQSATIQAITYASTITLNLTQGNDASVTLTGNTTIANPSTMPVGASGHIKLTQDSTGSRTVTWGSYWKFGAAGTPVLSTAANAVDVLFYWVMDSTHVVCALINGVQ